MRKSVRSVLKVMSYRDMVDLSEIIEENLDGVATAEKIAQVLSDLPTTNEQVEVTNKHLAAMFGRKRQITVQPMKDGVYKFCCPSFEGAVVFDKDIREGMSQMLDTIAVLKGLE